MAKVVFTYYRIDGIYLLFYIAVFELRILLCANESGEA